MLTVWQYVLKLKGGSSSSSTNFLLKYAILDTETWSGTRLQGGSADRENNIINQLHCWKLNIILCFHNLHMIIYKNAFYPTRIVKELCKVKLKLTSAKNINTELSCASALTHF